MNCEDVYTLLSAKLDGALSASEEEHLNAHLENCSECRRLYEAMFEIEEETKKLTQPAPEGLKRGVMYRIRQENGAGTKKRRFFGFGFGTGLGAAAAVLVLLIGTGVVRLPRHAISSQAPASSIAGEPNNETESPLETNVFTPVVNQNGWNFLDSKVISGEGSTPAITQDPETPDAAGSTVISGEGSAPPITQDPETPDAAWSMEGTPAEPGEEGSTKSAWFHLPNPFRQDAEQDALCRQLSAEAEAPVLLYSDFTDRSLLTLLQDAEPKLFDRLTENEPIPADQALGEDEASDPDEQPVVYRVDYESLLALQEWLLLNLPQSDPTAAQTTNRLQVRMEELDPGSGALNRIITWSEAAKPVDWPEDWPEDWAERLRSGESWGLYYPAEDFIPRQDAAAYLVFPAE